MKLLNVILLVLILPYVPVLADDGHGHSHDGDDASASSSITGGDQVISGGDTFAASHSLGDVDIEGCVVTKQWGSFIVSHQYYEYDVFCIADKLDSQGKYAAAAALRCSDKDTKKLFGDSCLSVWTFKPSVIPTIVATPNQEDEAPTSDDDWDDDDGPDRDIAYEALLERVTKIEEEKDANVRRYNRDQEQRAEKEEARKLSAKAYLDRLPPTQQQKEGLPDGN